MMKNIEILAPVGNRTMLEAAVYSGADAVYLGLGSFNARRSAGNFTPEELAEAVCFCHARGVKVHVTLNTTLYTPELPAVAQCICQAAQAGADALIVQDLAVAELAKQIAPGLALHGSTQMSVHTAAGVRQLARMGFSRAILARELSLEEIAAIAKDSPIETEVFVHGALCMSMSGQCYMSAFLGGRSGNRGSCAGPCRLPFDAARIPEGQFGRNRHLSLKDNSVIASLPALQAAGVVSAKIEGRLRTSEYVAAAVTACRSAREGLAYDADTLQNVFSRSGFTCGYIEGKIDRTMFGVRTEEDAALTKAALPGLRELFRREYSGVPVDFVLEVEEMGVKLSVTDGTDKISVYGEAEPQPAQNDPTESLKRSLSKTGGTPFRARNITIEMDGGPWFLPGSVVNELRRTALEKLLARRSVPAPLATAEAVLPPALPRGIPAVQKLAARFEEWDQIPAGEAEALEQIILPLVQAFKVPAPLRSKTILELPRAMFGTLEQTTRASVEATSRMGFAGYLANNPAHFELCRGLPVYGGFGLNVTNALAAQSYADLGAKGVTLLPEVTCVDMQPIHPTVPTAAFVYGHMPLMLTRACPLQNVTDCAHCSRQGQLTDRKAKKFPVRCALGMRTVYNPIPIYMGDKTDDLPVDLLVAYFSIESRERAGEVLALLRGGRPFDQEFTRGLYYKGTT